MANSGSRRETGDWPPELRELVPYPHVMLLGAVVMRARRDAARSASAERFVAAVRRYCVEGKSSVEAVLMAMGNGEGAKRIGRH